MRYSRKFCVVMRDGSLGTIDRTRRDVVGRDRALG